MENKYRKNLALRIGSEVAKGRLIAGLVRMVRDIDLAEELGLDEIMVGKALPPVGIGLLQATLVLLAAILAFPAPWRHKAIGLVIGVVAVQALNIIRVISLFYLGQWSMLAFEWAHLYLWQALIMLDVLIVWLIWIRKIVNIEV